MSPPSKKSETAARSRHAQRALDLPSLVAVELGAPFPAWISRTASTGQYRVIAAREGEALDAFTARVCERARELVKAGTELEAVILVCNERTDEAVLAARRHLARAVCEAGASGREPRFLLTASRKATPRLRQALQELVPSLGERPARASVRIDDEVERLPESTPATVANVA